MAYRLRGEGAELRWGYYRAATLGAWTLEDQVLHATVREVDTFRVAQRPLVLVVGRTQWPLDEVTVSDHRVSGRVARG